MELPIVFTKLEEIFSINGYSLWMVGGTSRDFLMNNEINDFDFVTDATPEQMKEFLKLNDSFSSLGSCHLVYLNKNVDITTLRKEGKYSDFRHPDNIEYVKNIREDSKRRDFSINAIYIDKNGKIYDFYHGKDDISNHLITMIGNPKIRLKEDPIRILRALRFSLKYDFSITPSLMQDILNLRIYLKKIPLGSLNIELDKIREISNEKANWMFKILHLDDYILLDNLKNRLNVIDMHCDTATRDEFIKEGLFDNSLHVSLKKLSKGQYLMQTFAIFIDLKKVKSPFKECKKYIFNLKKQFELNKQFVNQIYSYSDLMNTRSSNKIGCLISLEDAGILEGKIENLQYLYNLGVRMITLTWNYKNEVGFPNVDLNKKNVDYTLANENDGLTEFGINLIKEMNRLGIIIDVSHLSDKGFYDCIKYSTKPIVASHSNCRSLCNQARNLTDDMILKLKENKGIMGINLCNYFLSEKEEISIDDIVKHINHIKDIAGIDVIALGTDFDGIPTNEVIPNCEKILELKDTLVKNGYKQNEINKLFYENFIRVFKKVCK